MFVTLEPCAHKGSNGTSCADLISDSGIKEIFISNLDPDLRTSGKGLKILKKGREETLNLKVGEIEKNKCIST